MNTKLGEEFSGDAQLPLTSTEAEVQASDVQETVEEIEKTMNSNRSDFATMLAQIEKLEYFLQSAKRAVPTIQNP